MKVNEWNKFVFKLLFGSEIILLIKSTRIIVNGTVKEVKVEIGTTAGIIKVSKF